MLIDLLLLTAGVLLGLILSALLRANARLEDLERLPEWTLHDPPTPLRPVPRRRCPEDV